MIRKSGYRFSEKIMLNEEKEQDEVSKKTHPALDFKKMLQGGNDE